MSTAEFESEGSGGGREREACEEPDLDLSCIGNEFVPLEDAFVPFYDIPEAELELSGLCAPLEGSFASFDGGQLFFRTPSRPFSRYDQNTSTPRFFDAAVERPESARGTAMGAAGGCDQPANESMLAELLADLQHEAPPPQLHETSQQQSPPNQQPDHANQLQQKAFNSTETREALIDEFVHSVVQQVGDGVAARAIHCFRTNIPIGTPDHIVLSYMTHMLRYPMRRPMTTLLSTNVPMPVVLQQIIKATMDGQLEAYDAASTRASYLRITMKNSVGSLKQLYEMVSDASRAFPGFVTIRPSTVKGTVAFLDYNGSLPIRITEPLCSFVKLEEVARRDLSAHFMAEFTLMREGDPAREVMIKYYDSCKISRSTGFMTRKTETSVYHIVHPYARPAAAVAATPPRRSLPQPLASAAAPSPPQQQQLQQQQQPQQLLSTLSFRNDVRSSYLAGPPPPLAACAPPPPPQRCVSFNPAPPIQYEVPVNRQMKTLDDYHQKEYTLDEVLYLAQRLSQLQW